MKLDDLEKFDLESQRFASKRMVRVERNGFAFSARNGYRDTLTGLLLKLEVLPRFGCYALWKLFFRQLDDEFGAVRAVGVTGVEAGGAAKCAPKLLEAPADAPSRWVAKPTPRADRCCSGPPSRAS